MHSSVFVTFTTVYTPSSTVYTQLSQILCIFLYELHKDVLFRSYQRVKGWPTRTRTPSGGLSPN